MPWVRLDDRFPSHRKVALLSDRAFRLYVSALCWSSEQLTEGRILDRELPVVARLRGPRTAAKELEAAGLWERIADGWEIHDYLEYQRSRERVQADRAATAARQQAFRDRKKTARNAPSNGVTDEPETGSDDSNATRRRHDGDTTERRTGPENLASPQVNEERNAVTNASPAQAQAPASPTEKQASRNAAPLGPQIPDFATDLVAQMGAAGMVVGWGLADAEWFAVHDRIRRVGLPTLVEQARRRWNPADPPKTARYLLKVWADLPDATAPVDGPRLRAVDEPPRTRAQQTTEWFRQAAQNGGH